MAQLRASRPEGAPLIGRVPSSRGRRRYVLNTVHMACAFFLVFTAFTGISVRTVRARASV